MFSVRRLRRRSKNFNTGIHRRLEGNDNPDIRSTVFFRTDFSSFFFLCLRPVIDSISSDSFVEEFSRGTRLKIRYHFIPSGYAAPSIVSTYFSFRFRIVFLKERFPRRSKYNRCRFNGTVFSAFKVTRSTYNTGQRFCKNTERRKLRSRRSIDRRDKKRINFTKGIDRTANNYARKMKTDVKEKCFLSSDKFKRTSISSIRVARRYRAVNIAVSYGVYFPVTDDEKTKFRKKVFSNYEC